MLSWHDERLISECFSILLKIEKLKQRGLIKDSPFTVYTEPWTQNLEVATREFLFKNFKSLLKDIRLNNVHPVVVQKIMRCATGVKGHLLGMDFQLLGEFKNANKVILQLDVSDPKEDRELEESRYKALEQMATEPHISRIESLVKYFKEISSKSSKKVCEKLMVVDEPWIKGVEEHLKKLVKVKSLNLP